MRSNFSPCSTSLSLLRLNTMGLAVGLFLLFLIPQQAWAVVAGARPAAFQTYSVFGDYNVVGNTMMANTASSPLVNSVLLTSSSSDVSGVPTNAAIEGAYLFWTGSTDPAVGTDQSVSLQLPNGTTATVNADTCRALNVDVGGGTVDYFYCRADVSALLTANPGAAGGPNGRYTVSGLSALRGQLNAAGTCVNANCQAFYAAWSMVTIWSSDSETTLRDVSLFDGFRAVDETAASAGIDTYSLSGFTVASPPNARFTVFALEGDAVLGIPPQDVDATAPCTTCFDYIKFNGTKLSNASNPANNAFNSTIPTGSALGVDIDTYDVSSLVTAGATTAAIEIGSGDGNTATGQNNGSGGGELFIVGFNVISVNRAAPNFRTSTTRKSVVPTTAAPGDILFYTIDVTNDGSANGTNVIVRDTIPANTTYIAGSTLLDDVLVPDVSGRSAIVGGLNVGTIPPTGDNSRRITFRAQVNAGVASGTLITNSANISATELTEVQPTNTVTTTITSPAVRTPTKSYLDLNGGLVEPGDAITYTVTILKDATQSVTGLTFQDDITAFANLLTVSAGGFTDESLLAGGANGTGLVKISGISSPIGSDRVTLSFTVRIKTVADLLAAGVTSAAINGLLISNQGQVTAPFLSTPKLTDDPTTAAAIDATNFSLSAAVNFDNTSTFKTVTDLNGGFAVPGDAVQYVISVRNDGSVAGQIDITDDLPANLTGATLAAPVTGVTLRPAPVGANGTGRIEAFGLSVAADTTITIRINATIAAAAPNGASLRNTAQLTVIDFPDQSQALQSQELLVTSGPDFTNATKSVSGATGGFEPGDVATFTISATNNGVTDGANVVVTDVIDSRFTAITPANGGTYNAATRTITWNVGAVALGASFTVGFTARIAVTVTNGTTISNQASITATGVTTPVLTDDPATVATDDPTTLLVQAVPALTLTKSVTDLNGGNFEPGDTVRYTLALNNAGRAAATAVIVRDPLPAATFTAIAASAGGTLAGTAVTWNATTTPALASVDPGETVTLTLDATLLATVADGSTVSNQAALTGAPAQTLSSDDPTTATAADPTTFTINASAVLSVAEKTFIDANGGEPQPGDTITWSIRLLNSGSGPARDVVITDVIDANLTNVNAAPEGVFDTATRTISWTLADVIAAGAERTVTYTSVIAAGLADGTVIPNQATIESPDLTAAVVTDDPATAAAADATTLTVVSQPDFATSTKEVVSVSGAADFKPGDEVLYTITVINTGTEDATDVSVTDAVDTGSLTSLVIANGGTETGGTITWTIPALAAGASTQVGFRATLAFPLADGTLVSNQAFVSTAAVAATPTDDPTTADLADPTVFTVSSQPDLSFSTKSFVDANGLPAVPGDAIDYLIVVINNGTAPATNVVVTDLINANFATVEPGTGLFDGATRTLRWDATTEPGLASVGVGEAAAVRLTFRGILATAIDNATIISNQAQITADEGNFVSDDPTTTATGDTTNFQIVSGADFGSSIKLVSAPGPLGYRPGDTVTYSIRVSNTGTAAARAAVVTDLLPANLTFVSATQGGLLTGGTVTWNGTTTPALNSLAVGGAVDLQVVAQINANLANGTVIANQVQMTATGFAAPQLTDDPTTTAADDATAFTVTSAANLSTSTKAVLDEDGDGIFEPGDTVLYTIVVTNSGDAPAANVVVRDLVSLATLDNITVLDGGTFATDTITWSGATTPALASVAAGPTGAVTVRFRARIKAGTANATAISNQAFIAADGTAEVPTDDAANGLGDDNATTFNVVAQPRLDTATKTVTDLNGGAVQEGDVVEYTIAVSNTGTEPAQGVVVSDPIPTQLTDVTVVGGTLVGSAAEWTVGTLAPGDRRTFTLRATIRPGLTDGTVISNQAFVASTGFAPEVTDNPVTPTADDATTIIVDAFGDLSGSEKTVEDLNGGFIEPGDTIRYTITVRNGGLAASERVVVTDALPPELALGAVISNGGRIAAGTVTWNAATTPALASIAVGGQVLLTVQTIVPDTALSGTTYSNQASLTDASGRTAVTDDPATAAIDDATLVTVFFPELGLATKSVVDLNGDNVEPLDRLEYTIAFGAGTGPALTNVLVTDLLDGLLTDIAVGQGGRFDEATRTVSWSAATSPELGRVDTGGRVALTFQATVAANAPDATLLLNQAILASVEVPSGTLSDDPATEEADDPTAVLIVAPAKTDLGATTKVATDLNGGLLEPGDRVAYLVTIPNAGPGRSVGGLLIDPSPTFGALVAGSVQVNGVAEPDGASLLATGLALPPIEAGAQATVAFEVTVSADAPIGGLLSNSALVSDRTGIVWRSDDPATPEFDDPTDLVIGEGVDLSRSIKAFTLQDADGDGQADVGEVVHYVIGLINRGNIAATNVVLSDLLPANLGYVAGSLKLDTVSATDAADGDFGSVVDADLEVTVGRLEAGDTRAVEFDATILAGPTVVNQASINSDQVRLLTDDDGNPANGISPTVVIVGAPLQDGALRKTVADANGGLVEPGDTLVYTVNWRASGSKVLSVAVTDSLTGPAVYGAILTSDADTLVTLGLPASSITFPGLLAREERTVVYAVQVGADAQVGDLICNTLAATAVATPDPVCVTVGGEIGVAAVSGTIFYEPGETDGLFGEGDEALPGYVAELEPRAGGTGVIRRAVADADGKFDFGSVPAGSYSIGVFAEGGSASGTGRLGDRDVDLANGGAFVDGLAASPMGVLYGAKTLAPASGQQMFLYYSDDEPDSLLAGRKIDPALLGHPSQQGQRVGARGFYRFDPPTGHLYRIEVATAGTNTAFPSEIFPPVQEALVVQAPVQVVAGSDPATLDDASRKYHTLLDWRSNDGAVTRNHLPLDPSDSRIELTKRADRVSAYVGGIVTYTLRVINRSNTDITYAPALRQGGGILHDTPPAGFRLVDRSPHWTLRRADGRVVETAEASVTGERLLDFGRKASDGLQAPFDLPAGGELELKYQMVIGSSIEPGRIYKNEAVFRSGDGATALSNSDRAELRIDFDPVFDQGDLLGKVFCDTDGDGRQQEGEFGIWSARLFLDTGSYVDADRDGRFHFGEILPGLHLVKLDTATLPPGSSLTTDERRLFNVTRGTPSVVNFGVTCAENFVGPTTVEPGDATRAMAEKMAQARFFQVVATTKPPRVTIDGQPLPTLDASLALSLGRSRSGQSGSGRGDGGNLIVRWDDTVIDTALNFRLSSSSEANRWVLEVVELGTGLVVWQSSKDGKPPASLDWDGTDGNGNTLLAPRRAYEARFRVFEGNRRMTEAPAMPFLVAGQSIRYLVDQKFQGTVSAKGRLPEAFRKMAKELAPRLLSTAPNPIRVEVHLDDDPDKEDEQAQSTAMAQNIVKYLTTDLKLPKDRVTFEAFGSTKPIYPNISDRPREINRRIMLRVRDPAPAAVEVSLPARTAPVAEVIVNRRSVARGAAAAFTDKLPKPVDGIVVVTLRGDDGSVRSSSARVRDPLAASSIATPAFPSVPLDVDMTAGRIKLGSASVTIDGLGLKVDAAEKTGVLRAGKIEPAIAATVAGIPTEVASWRAEIADEFGDVIYEKSGDGAPSATFNWAGETTVAGASVSVGEYDLRLFVKRKNSAQIASAPLRVGLFEASSRASARKVAAAEPVAAQVRVNGKRLTGTTKFASTVEAATGMTVWVDLLTADNARALVPVVVPAGFDATVKGATTLAPYVIQAVTLSEGSGADAVPAAPASPASPAAAPASPATPAVAPAAAPASPAAPAGTPAPAAPAAAPAANPFAPLPGGASLLLRPLQFPTFTFLPAPLSAQVGALTTPPEAFDELSGFYWNAFNTALDSEEGADLAVLLANSPASDLQVDLPAEGLIVESEQIVVRGRTDVRNTLTVNGAPVTLDETGAFEIVVPIPAGESTLLFEATDEGGNVGRLSWPVRGATSRFFVMALADTAIGTTDARIEGSNEDNAFTTDGGMQVYGQGRVYLKGYVRGSELLGDFAKRLDVTAHADTGKRSQFESFVNEVIEPERSYPVYGDGSEAVADVKGRGKVYILVEADKSRAVLGSFRTGMSGLELFKYDRALYGGQLVVDNKTEVTHTELRTHVASDDQSLVHTFNLLRGTGGSVYYLENRALLEGSERVTLVVRDATSGVELLRIPQSRNTDYTIRYGEGRIVFRHPLPSVVDDATAFNGYQSTRSTLVGNPLYVEVAYDHENGSSAGDTSAGVQGRETLWDTVTVGGGLVQENRLSGQDYKLWGAELGIGKTQTTRLDLEYAESEAQDTSTSYSDDGGLRFRPLRLASSNDASGTAMTVRGRFELADVMELGRDRVWSTEVSYRNQDRGFFSNGSLLTQGEEKTGLATTWLINDRHQFGIKADKIDAIVEDLTTVDLSDTIRLSHSTTTAQYEFNDEGVGMQLGFEHNTNEDPRLAAPTSTDIAKAGLGFKFNDDFRIGVEQEIIVAGDDTRLIRGADLSTETRFDDRFVSTLSAGYQVTDSTEVSATERFRYSGENATSVGLRTETADDTTVYVQQRMTNYRDNHGAATSTVVGGEQKFGEDAGGRAYTEIQNNGGIGVDRQSALVGLGRTWKVTDNISLDLAYERSQTLIGRANESDHTRDAGSIGWQWKKGDDLTLNGLAELRLESASLGYTGATPCLATATGSNPANCRDALTSLGDRQQLTLMNTATYKLDQDWTLFGRFDLVTTENTTLHLEESRDVETGVGAAFRPVDTDWLNLLFRYTYLDEIAPYGLELGMQSRESSHVFSVSPILELPWNLQFVEKVALRNIHLEVEDLPEADNTMTLWVNRLNYHIVEKWDAGLEYRLLHQSLTKDWQQGTLLELNYIIATYVRLGVGYNFTKFAEDELGDFNRDSSGVFFRVTAQY